MVFIKAFSLSRKNFHLSIPELHLPQKGLFLLCGENGSGKSAFLSCLAGINNKYEGSILINGQPLRELSRLQCASMMSYLPQTSEPLPSFLAKDFLRQGLYAGGEERSENLLHFFQQDNLIHKRCDACSGGEAQVLRLVRACAAQKALVLLDEPESFLSQKRKALLADFLEKEAQNSLVIAAVHQPHLFPSAQKLNIHEKEEGVFALL